MSLREDICALREQLRPAKCAETLGQALDYVEQQLQGNATSAWLTNWPRNLPAGLRELVNGWDAPIFKPLEIQNAYLTTMVAQWHLALYDVLDNFCSNANNSKVLCGFNVVNDILFSLGQSHDLADLWGACGRCSPGLPIREPANLSDALACLVDIINNPSKDGKFYPDSATLEQIRNGANSARLTSNSHLGGAAGNMAYILGHMGAGVHLHCPYHSDQLEWKELNTSVHCLEFEQTPDPKVKGSSSRPNLPYKTTAGFQAIPRWSFPQLKVTASEAGRTLFIGRNPTLSPRPWNDVKVLWEGSPEVWQGRWNTLRDAWPYPSVFHTWDINGQTLEIKPVSSQHIEKLAQTEEYDVALLRDVCYKPTSDLLQQARKAQLDALRNAGVPIHVELSPGFDPVSLRGYIIGSSHPTRSHWSASLNQDELLQIVDRTVQSICYQPPIPRWNPSLLSPQVGPAGLLQRFRLAWHLMQILEFDWVYVHGNEMDITVWRPDKFDSGTELGSKLRDGMLLAKAAVVRAMIERHAAPLLQQVVNGLLLPGTALAAKGFWALLFFAYEFKNWAEEQLEKEGKMSKKQIQDEVKDIWNGLLMNGTCELGNDIGIAVAPVFWPDIAQFLNATGAGDYSSAVVATHASK